ncbi:hypothetical protein TMatcc_003751 [Talaromyces marneffei ATCC 18224]
MRLEHEYQKDKKTSSSPEFTYYQTSQSVTSLNEKYRQRIAGSKSKRCGKEARFYVANGVGDHVN